MTNLGRRLDLIELVVFEEVLVQDRAAEMGATELTSDDFALGLVSEVVTLCQNKP